ncbi:hypothetical protein PQG67_10615, partial [Corynebacterium pseudodiphtheriticum]|uniref:hypothetical protein n=1 Tax=Corynebacterium pseudodiphtheriticum TaxID=37637 RepID=UPI00234E167D
YALERLVKKYFAELVDSGDVKLGDAYTVPTPEKAFEENKDTIAAELKKSQDPDAVGKSVARKYLAGFEGDTAGFGKF